MNASKHYLIVNKFSETNGNLLSENYEVPEAPQNFGDV